MTWQDTFTLRPDEDGSRRRAALRAAMSRARISRGAPTYITASSRPASASRRFSDRARGRRGDAEEFHHRHRREVPELPPARMANVGHSRRRSMGMGAHFGADFASFSVARRVADIMSRRHAERIFFDASISRRSNDDATRRAPPFSIDAKFDVPSGRRRLSGAGGVPAARRRVNGVITATNNE